MLFPTLASTRSIETLCLVDQYAVQKLNPTSLPFYGPSRKNSKALTSGSGCLSRRGHPGTLVSSEVAEDSVLSDTEHREIVMSLCFQEMSIEDLGGG